MGVVRVATKGGLHHGAFVCRGIGDFGIPVFLWPGWRCRPKAASLTRGSEVSGVREDGMQFNQRRKGLGYDGERQEKCDFGA